MGILIILSILAFFTYTPLGEIISPAIPRAGDFVQTYISGASDSAFWISTYICCRVDYEADASQRETETIGRMRYEQTTIQRY
jgi:hypothetical protein